MTTDEKLDTAGNNESCFAASTHNREWHVTREPQPLFQRFIAVEEMRCEDDGTIIGNRLGVRIEASGVVHILRQDRCAHGKSEEEKFDWDWTIDPDAGICTSRDGAKELLEALRDGLVATLADHECTAKATAIAEQGVSSKLSTDAVTLAQALRACVIDCDNFDCCGVCHEHIVDCDKAMMVDDWPNGKESLACAGARARVILRSLDVPEFEP